MSNEQGVRLKARNVIFGQMLYFPILQSNDQSLVHLRTFLNIVGLYNVANIGPTVLQRRPPITFTYISSLMVVYNIT